MKEVAKLQIEISRSHTSEIAVFDQESEYFLLMKLFSPPASLNKFSNA
jgi:hypothetical protein